MNQISFGLKTYGLNELEAGEKDIDSKVGINLKGERFSTCNATLHSNCKILTCLVISKAAISLS